MCILFNTKILKSVYFKPILWMNSCLLSCLETDDGRHWSSSSLLATGPLDSHLCGQWPIHVRDSGVPVFCVRGVSACDLADQRAERDHRQAGDVEASGRVLVRRLWFHPRRHWGMVLAVLWCHSRRPELPVTAVWVQTRKVLRKVHELHESICVFIFSLTGKEYSKGDSRYVMWVRPLHRTMLNVFERKGIEH